MSAASAGGAPAAHPTLTASAPGKLLLAGEYAVLRGAEAVVVAMDRRAVATWPAAGPRADSPFLDALVARLRQRLGADHLGARAAAELAVDTAAFSHQGQKLGLGSSAAATVAAAALALGAGGQGVSAAAVFELAAAAHGDAQGRRGTRGSGADIAASAYGGALRFALGERGASVAPLPLPRSVTLVPFFTGVSADTVTMVAHVERAGAAAAPALAAIAAAAAELATAFERDRADAIVAAVAAGGRALAELGQRAGYDLETAAVRAARAHLEPLGAAVKTTGAGGGDLAVAVAPAEIGRNDVAAALIQAGCQVLPLSIDPSGVDLRQPSV